VRQNDIIMMGMMSENSFERIYASDFIAGTNYLFNTTHKWASQASLFRLLHQSRTLSDFGYQQS
jgi:hypothetical protein